MWLLTSLLLLFCLIQHGGSIDPIKLMQIYGKKQAKQTRIQNCSIHKAAIVRQILVMDFFPIFTKYGVEVPSKCKFHKDRDIFMYIEGNQTIDNGLTTKCEICGKEFYKQYYFYEHAIRKHSSDFLQGPTAVCLADYCAMFRCDLHEKYPHDIPSEVKCDKKNVDKLRRKCEHQMRSCLPDKMFHYVYDQLYLAICSTLTCEKFLHPFQDSISITKVIALSIAIPVSLLVIGQILLMWYDSMDSVDDDAKYLHAQQVRYEARNAEYNERFYGLRNRAIGSRYRGPKSHLKYGNSYRYKLN